MDNIIKMIAEKAGISEAQAQTAITTLMGFLKDKMPGGIGAQVESFIKGGGAATGGDMMGGLKDKVGGMFGN
jgi:hypothetical protein